jgi:formylglycine-generating enzyme required for sulfatase activity
MGRSGFRFAAAVVVLFASAAACGAFPDLGGLSDNIGDEGLDVAKNDGPGAPDVGSDVSILDGGADAPAEATSDGGCPSGRGPVMVKVDSKTCIDTTEVTVAQYRTFVNSVDGGFPQPNECAWNASFVPLNGVPSTSKDPNPIANINWCQAEAFCAWAGKSLCGAPDGGPYPYLAFSSSSQSTWMNACSANGSQSYPYGTTFEAGACNIPTQPDANAPVAPAGSFTKCQGSVTGVFDMVGNIKEWDNACLPSGGDAAADLCRRRGAGFDDPSGNPVNKTCGWDEVDTRNHQSFTSGVRCCAYLP